MIRILLKKRSMGFKRYTADLVYSYTYLDIGYKGSIFFISIIQEQVIETLLYADMLWHSNF